MINFTDYLKVNPNIFVTPLIGYVNARFLNSGEQHKILCYTVDGNTPIILNPIRYFDESIVGSTINSAQVESNTYISTTAGTAFENVIDLPAYIENKCYGNVKLKQINKSIPGQQSNNFVIQQVTSGTSSLSANIDTYYILEGGTVTITLPTLSEVNKVKTIVFYLTTDSNPNITFTSSTNIVYSDGFDIEADSVYEINALYNGESWVIAQLKVVPNP